MDLSHPLLRAPFEKANKAFRLYHKQLTKELAAATKSLTDLHDEQPPAQRTDVDALVGKLDELVHSIRALKQDAKQRAAEQQRELESCLRRARYVRELEAAAPHMDPKRSAPSVDEALRSATQRALADRLIADYLLSRGHLGSAALVQESTGVGHLVDHALHAECHAILLDLRARSTASALAWCAQNASRLRRLPSRLEFRLRLQDFVELVRAREPLAAIEYAQTWLTPLALQREDSTAQRADLGEIEVAMGTLAFPAPEQSGQAHYAKLFAADAWAQLVADFQRTFLAAYGLHDPPSLCVALYTGLSVLNTRTCQRHRDAAKAKLARSSSSLDCNADGTQSGAAQPRSKKTKLAAATDGDGDDGDDAEEEEVEGKSASARLLATHGDKVSSTLASEAEAAAAVPLCPSCSEVGSALCSGLPFAFHPHSRLVCRVTRKVMDEHNPPRVLPNGFVYSQDGIAQLLGLAERSGMIACAETQELFPVSAVKPVYIL
ncbi:hypothetical protein PybrP1_005316 [[Pythium] brassicae (nom. inval.)]|nr:hypothetical protein PybrP1_005316 [[Pythium] brassicae (nom. inval.)]